MTIVPYCERLGPGLLAEPWNLFSNVAFFAAAGAAWLMMLSRRVCNTANVILLMLCLTIAIGSTLFHLHPAIWTRAFDEVPILLFQLWFLWLYFRAMMSLNRLPSTAMLVAYISVAMFARGYPQILNGSLVYAPALWLMAMLGVYHLRHATAERSILLVTTAIFTLSVSLRSMDMAVCSSFPIGTHFLWHVLNGLVLYLSMRTLMNHPQPGNSP